MAKSFGTLVHPELKNPENDYIGNFRPVTLPTDAPVPSEQALLCVQSFVNATGIPADRVISEALRYWWDEHGGYIVQRIERKLN